jgi:inosine triphosphate pyrophosphatase
MREIVFVTSNQHKLNEAKTILDGFNVIAINFDMIEIQGNVDSIAKHKCLSAFEKINTPCFVEDTSLFFDAWKELPGPYIKIFLENIGPAGLYKALNNFDNKSAKALCTIGYMDHTLSEPLLFRGETIGEISSPKGESGFEWDKIFIPDGYNQTFSELGMGIKNEISHRKKALIKLSDYLDSIIA